MFWTDDNRALNHLAIGHLTISCIALARAGGPCWLLVGRPLSSHVRVPAMASRRCAELYFFQRRDPCPPPISATVIGVVASHKIDSDWSTVYRDKNGGQ
jgi:hypothetical protein